MRLQKVNGYSQQSSQKNEPRVGVFQGFIIMLVFMFAGVILSFTFGTVADGMHDSFTDAGLFDVVNPDWDMASDNVTSLYNLLYVIMYGLPLIGVGIFLMTIIARQQYEHGF